MFVNLLISVIFSVIISHSEMSQNSHAVCDDIPPYFGTEIYTFVHKLSHAFTYTLSHENVNISSSDILRNVQNH